MPLFQINFDLIPIKFHYFLWGAGTAPIVPFIPTLGRQLGFSTKTVGTIYTFLPIFGLLAKPLFGAVSDRFKVQKLLFLSFIVLTGSTFYGILYIPNVVVNNQVLLECGEGETFFKHCSDKPPDVCLKQKILAEGNEKNSATYLCEITCQSQDLNFLEQLCESWQVSKFCPSSSSGDLPPKFFNNLKTPGHSVSKKLDPSQQGKYDIHAAKVGRSVATGTGSSAPLTTVIPAEVRFTADISAYHIVEVETCLHFPMKHVHIKNDNKTTSHLPLCKQALHVSTCSVSCNSDEVMSYLSSTQTGFSDETSSYQFWLFFILLSSSWIGSAVVVSLADTICFELLGNEPHKYGEQRVWMSIGWGGISLLAGFLVDHFSSSSSNKNYTPVFYLMLAMLLFDLFVSSKIRTVQSSTSPNILKDVTKLLVEPTVLTFLLWCASAGVCTALIWQYLFWFLEDLAAVQGCASSAWIKTLEGLVMTVQCLAGELPFFFLSGWFIRKLGHTKCMVLILLTFSLRFYLLSLLTNPWGAVPIELLNGVTVGLFWSTMTSYANIIAPPGTEATIQGLVGGLFEGVGVSVGSLLGGYLFDSYGGRNTFKIFSVLALIMCSLHLTCHYLLKVKAQYGMSEDSVKGVSRRARYATPTEAIHMLEDVNG